MEPFEASPDWLERCAYRLKRQWPTLAEGHLQDTARALQADPELARMAPEAAAVAWLRRGVLID